MLTVASLLLTIISQVRRNIKLGKAIDHKMTVEHAKKAKERAKDNIIAPDEVDNVFFDSEHKGKPVKK